MDETKITVLYCPKLCRYLLCLINLLESLMRGTAPTSLHCKVLSLLCKIVGKHFLGLGTVSAARAGGFDAPHHQPIYPAPQQQAQQQQKSNPCRWDTAANQARSGRRFPESKGDPKHVSLRSWFLNSSNPKASPSTNHHMFPCGEAMPESL